MIKKIKILNDYYFCNVNSVVYTLLYLFIYNVTNSTTGPISIGSKNQEPFLKEKS